jgi:hypothetical protein
MKAFAPPSSEEDQSHQAMDNSNMRNEVNNAQKARAWSWKFSEAGVVGIRVIVYWKVQANICVQVCCLLHAS